MTNYDKKYFEEYAKQSLAFFLNEKMDNFLTTGTERPDLQNPSDSIGIEVTQAISEHEAMSNNLCNRFFGKGLSGDDIKNEISKNPKYWNKFKGNITSIGKTAAVSPTCGLVDFKEHLNKISFCIEKNLKKINKANHYNIFKSNYLYIFSHNSLIDKDDIERLFPELKTLQDYSPIKYDAYMINCINKIYIIYSNNFRISLHEYNDEDLRGFKSQSLK